MLRFDSALSGVFVGVVGLGVLSLQGSVRGQIAAHAEFDRGAGVVRGDGVSDEVAMPDVVGTVIVGRVIGPDGAPAVGAVVVTSAGGQAVTDAEGAFSLEVGVPVSVKSVRVTAVMGSGTGSLVGGAQVGALALWGTTAAGTLILEQSAGCQPSWLPTFGGLVPGFNGPVTAFAVFDDGSGPALYAGGEFSTAGGVPANYIAKWNGSSWSALGNGMNYWVVALTVFDDGSGPALYAGGEFSTAGGVPANYIAKWNGSSWSALGNGMNDWVVALTVFDDGSGPALYAGGNFTTAGGVAANRIAKWNGTVWSAVGHGVNNLVYAVAVFDDGSGPALYAGGGFTDAGGVPANYIAKWNGSSWSALGSGMDNAVSALAVFDDDSGPALYVGGYFTTAGGVAANAIAKWSGSSWSALGSGLAFGSYQGQVRALMAFDDGSGPALYAGGLFTTAGGVAANSIAKWNGSSWKKLGSGMSGFEPFTIVYALTVFDDGSGPALYAGGYFTAAGGVPANYIAKWNGATWSPDGLDGGVAALTVFDDGSGPALYVGGSFTFAGGAPANGIAKWDGTSWSALGSGVGGVNPFVNALVVFDDGSGPALYVGGGFTTAGGSLANSIAKWNGTSWGRVAGVSGGAHPTVLALTVFDDGSGPALYAGGEFTGAAGGVAAKYIAKWNGTSWSALGSGMSGGMDPNVYVFALTVFDDGNGPALYAGGEFTMAGGVSANCIAKWNGSIWSPLGGGLSGATLPYVYVSALTVFDDGSGPALYAGGYFTAAGGVPANYIAKWDGSSWSALGSGVDAASYVQVSALAVFDDGSGPALYAGGWFTSAGGVAAGSIAKWDGTNWSALGSGTSGGSPLIVFDDGGGPALYAGCGPTSPAGDSYLAKWGGCSPPPSPWTHLGSGLAGISGIPQLNGTGDLLAGTPGKIRLIDAAPSAPAALFISASNTPTPFKGGILLTVPVLLTLPLATDSMGDILLPWAAWPSGLSGVSLYFQYAIQDSAAVKGVALSNALGADVP